MGNPGQEEAGATGGPPEHSLLAEQVRMLYEQVPFALGGSLAVAVVLAISLRNQHDAPLLLGWIGINVAVGLLRVWYWSQYNRQYSATEGAVLFPERWRNKYFFSTVLSGLIWALGSVVLFPHDSFPHQVFMAFLMGGLSAASLATYGPVPMLAPAFFAPALVAITTLFFSQGDELHLMMGGMVLVFLAVLTVVSRRMTGNILDLLLYRNENTGLVRVLDEARERAESLNVDLARKIQEQEQAEQSLRESEEKFRGLVEHATDGIILIVDGNIAYINRAGLEMIGYREHELLSKPLVDFLPDTPLGRPAMVERYQDRLAGRDVPAQNEGQLLTKDGRLITVLISSSLLRLKDTAGVISMFKDITPQKQTELELIAARDAAEEATAIKDQFVSLIAHDLRSPLNSLFATARLLMEDATHPITDEQRELLTVVENKGEAALRMIESLLNLSGLKTGKIQLKPRFLDGRPAVERAMGSLQQLAREKSVEIQNEVPPRTRLFADPESYGKVIGNLISNAIKYSPPGGRVRVFVPPHHPTTIAVEDQGAGIPPEFQDHLFDPERKTSLPGTLGELGAGLGLPLCQGIMKALGGSIRFESAPEQGTVFQVTLPAAKPRVMLLERNGGLGVFAKNQLETIEAECLLVRDHEEALTRLASDRVHLIIAEIATSDWAPFLSGVQTESGDAVMPVMLIAEDHNKESMDQAFQLGASDIIVKPLVPEEFMMRLRRFLI